MHDQEALYAHAYAVSLKTGEVDFGESGEDRNHSPGLACVVPCKVNRSAKEQVVENDLPMKIDGCEGEKRHQSGRNIDGRPAVADHAGLRGVEQPIGRHKVRSIDQNGEREPVRIDKAGSTSHEEDVDEDASHKGYGESSRHERVEKRGGDRRCGERSHG